jgi:hypothetical protein
MVLVCAPRYLAGNGYTFETSGVVERTVEWGQDVRSQRPYLICPEVITWPAGHVIVAGWASQPVTFFSSALAATTVPLGRTTGALAGICVPVGSTTGAGLTTGATGVDTGVDSAAGAGAELAGGNTTAPLGRAMDPSGIPTDPVGRVTVSADWDQ